jgi:phenylpyruvate tautomerase PptA (4-oxalocrotonate tautomerase family)
MPSSIIEVRRAYGDAEAAALIDAVHASLVTAFRIPEQDKHLRLVVHEPHLFAASPRLAYPELFTQVTIDCIQGRSMEAKRELYAQIVKRLEVLGIPGDHVLILLRESPATNWGIRGGQAASDVDLGFDVNV